MPEVHVQGQRRQRTPEELQRRAEKRHESRASSTYAEFLKDLQAKGFRSREEAERAAIGVLCALDQRLTSDQAWNLESQLPSKLKELVFRCERHTDLLPRDIDRAQFEEVVREHSTSGDRDAVAAMRLVFATVAQHVTPGEVRKVVSQLPGDLRELWPEWAQNLDERRPLAARGEAGSEAPWKIVDDLLALPIAAQVEILRGAAPKILGQLDPEERQSFLRDLEQELRGAEQGTSLDVGAS